MGELRLEAREFKDLTRWRWVLTDAGGTFLADHEVRLDAGRWQYEAFTDLLGYLQWHVAPDRWDTDEARIVGEVGAWIGAEVLGPVADALVRARPATVRVVAPAQARALLFRPLELGHARGRPLAVQDVTLVMEPDPPDGGGYAARARAGSGTAGERLRVLGLFSLPEGGQPLNLRRERYSLVQLISGIAARGKAADVRVLQYGVTRERLRDVLEEAEGWDVIHISGHGAPGELLLEDAAGRPDKVTAAELADLLDLARERVSLVTVAACWSAALTAAEQRRLLGLPVSGQRAGAGPASPDAGSAENHRDRDIADSEGRVADGRDDGFASGALAAELAGRLGCAVLAMRYPVGDDFAIALTGKLYDLLAAKGQPLPRAVGIALRQLMAERPARRPGLESAGARVGRRGVAGAVGGDAGAVRRPRGRPAAGSAGRTGPDVYDATAAEDGRLPAAAGPVRRPDRGDGPGQRGAGGRERRSRRAAARDARRRQDGLRA